MSVKLHSPLGRSRQAREIEIGRHRILFSYAEPVAVYDHEDRETFVTDTYWSDTTAGHIADWLREHHVQSPTEVSQREILARAQEIFKEA